ncbi:hypothetical protein V6N11_033878 [Hibiscus sabdariffa]|uniref:Uncharacterized protein n=1 Tax=Hibiscus sabdariffa TaxID=183260 RepID=A0ABR2S1P5_9ROSI
MSTSRVSLDIVASRKCAEKKVEDNKESRADLKKARSLTSHILSMILIDEGVDLFGYNLFSIPMIIVHDNLSIIDKLEHSELVLSNDENRKEDDGHGKVSLQSCNVANDLIEGHPHKE